MAVTHVTPVQQSDTPVTVSGFVRRAPSVLTGDLSLTGINELADVLLPALVLFEVGFHEPFPPICGHVVARVRETSMQGGTDSVR